MRQLTIPVIFLLTVVLISCHSEPPIRNQTEANSEIVLTTEADSVQHSNDLRREYDTLASKYFLQYGTYEEAVSAFQHALGLKLEPTRIAFYVPGKIPRDDGYPYFLLEAEIRKDYCMEGWFSLADSSIFKFYESYCGIIN